LDRNRAREIETDLVTFLSEFEKKWGVKITVTGGSFSSTSCFLKLEATEPNADGLAIPQAVADWKRFAKSYGLPEDGVGRKFIDRRREFRIEGFNPQAIRYPVIVKRDDGRGFKYPINLVLDCLGLPRSKKELPVAQTRSPFDWPKPGNPEGDV
jgi:hypothetical protein